MARRRRFSESPPSDILVVYLLFLFPLLCLLHFQIMTVSADTAPRVSDRDALLRFKSAVSSDPSGLLSGWSDSPGSNHCAWAGVTCDSRSRVWALNLSHEVLPCDLSSKGSGNSSSCLGSKSRLVGELSPAIGDLSELRVLAMPFHGLVGQLPSEISKLNCLEVLDLRGNSLSGPLPSRLGPRLRVLSLGLNRFDGEIPGFLSSCTYLEAVDLSHNDLTGAIPAFLGGLYNLKELRLSFNRLNETIPVEIGDNCSRLESLDLSGNMLVGGIPDRLGNCTSLRSLMLYSNHLDSGIPASFTRLSSLRHLSLADNNLTGGIPAGSAGWKSLELLDLSSNSLSGEIPSDLSTLRSLSVLLLHNNYFSGLVLASFNNLSGPIPRNASVGPENVLGNPLLDRTSDASSSSSSPALLLPSKPVARVRRFLQDTASADGNQSGKGTGSKNFSAIEIASITSASAIVSVLLALIVVYIYTRKCGKRSAVVSSARREVTLFREPGARLTYEIVIRATGNFNASNCIGSGGFGATYRAEIAPGILVAIKRLSAGRFHGLRQFHAEIKTLGRLQHSNLVTLYGYHVSESETFLIYNYLPGGNLENFIRKRSKRPIQWRMLHKIALDVACALAYLHDVCLPRILHRDVKPSNILLDNECNAYLSDFGLARLLGNSETHATTNVEGTFGYVAPEYAMTCRVSDRADVYSYGVVLLELISDKKALDPSFSPYANGFNIVQWARMLLEKGRAREFFFEGLWDVGPHDDLVEILRLAINCSDDTLSRRPKMKEVVQRLKQLQPPTF